MRRLLRLTLPFLPLALIAAAPAGAPEVYDRAELYDRIVSDVDRLYWDKARLGPNWADAVERNRARAIAARNPRDFYGAVQAMLTTIGDSHVYAVGPATVALDKARAAGEAGSSFGFSFWRDGAAWRILSVKPGSPAARAGIQIGWQLVSIDGEPAGSDFRSSLDRDSKLLFLDDGGRPRSLTLRGALIAPEPERRAERLPGGILHLALDVFSPGAERWVGDQLRDGPPPAGVILDLRENEGGDADAIARVAGRFFLEKQTLLRRTHRDGFEDVPIAGAGRRAYGGPLAVLVGPRSASGAEAIAAMIDESGRGLTVGDKTSGALTGADEIDLPDGGMLSVAVFDIRTPSGQRIEGRGFTPRYVVRPTVADLRAGRDPVLEKAVALLQEG
ncbi:S41 family peptidase [Sphingomonas naphthae]|uniref:S41 family peptidase n=1 Tax=Sphingomonas naphthae TaxID=1813468 RepID=A0ABY7TJK8_9SPHN|nr:S41 family peptidase [Sphingomonas naphthae]WCT73412.1 S41 family peptidase [Sphingomonas naphthae]